MPKSHLKHALTAPNFAALALVTVGGVLGCGSDPANSTGTGGASAGSVATSAGGTSAGGASASLGGAGSAGTLTSGGNGGAASGASTGDANSGGATGAGASAGGASNGGVSSGGASSGGGSSAGASSGAGSSGDAIVPPAGYHLVWHDEFDSDGAPSAANYNFEHGFQRNEEAQWYEDGNATVVGGSLVIEARKESVTNPNYTGSGDWKTTRKTAEYTSSSLTTSGKQSFQYGHFEMRARIPTEAGMWPAWWTLGVKGEWPSNGEIDIMEFYKNNLLANVACGTATRWQAKWDSSATPLGRELGRAIPRLDHGLGRAKHRALGGRQGAQYEPALQYAEQRWHEPIPAEGVLAREFGGWGRERGRSVEDHVPEALRDRLLARVPEVMPR
jgi:hypothetical protein